MREDASMAQTMTRTQIIDRLIPIVIKGSARGNGFILGPGEARIVIENMIASDTAHEWDELREGKETMRQVVDVLRVRK
jgi:hypothetical protein